MPTANACLTLLVAASTGLYVNLYSSQLTDKPARDPDDALIALGWWNVLLGVAALTLWCQLALTQLPTRYFARRRTELIQDVLEAACKTLVYPHATRHIRAFVTLRDGSTGQRTTRYSYNAAGDPERFASYPVEFGVTGKAYIGRAVVAEELPQDHHATYATALRQAVLPQVRTILAAPIFASERRADDPLGVLAFDSTLSMRTLKFDQLEAHAVAQGWADILSVLLLAPDER